MIVMQDLKFYQSQRMSDTDNGGGAMSLVEIQSANENAIFDDISDVNRAAGHVSIRKAFAAVTNDLDDKFLDAGVVIFRPPDDTYTSVLLHGPGDHYDQRPAIKSAIEAYRNRSVQTRWALYERQYAGSALITLYGTAQEELPSIGEVLNLVQWTSTARTAESASEYVRIVRITQDELRTFTDGNSEFERRVVILELHQPLKNTYDGVPMSKTPITAYSAALFTTRVVDSARYYGTFPLKEDADTDASAVYATALYERLIPSARSEMPHLDLGLDSLPTPVALSDTNLTLSNAVTWSAGTRLTLPQGWVPGTLSISAGAKTLVDRGRNLMDGTAIIGSVDAAAGNLTISSGTYAGAKTLSFRPALALSRPSQTLGVAVSETTQAKAYVAYLRPSPSPGSVRVEYTVQGNRYRLSDVGNGELAGNEVSWGSGTVNYTSGQVAVTLGALPDIDSTVIFLFTAAADAVRLETSSTTKVRPFPLTPQSVAGIDPDGADVAYSIDPLSISVTVGLTALEAVTPEHYSHATVGDVFFYLRENAYQDRLVAEGQFVFNALPPVGQTLTLAGTATATRKTTAPTFSGKTEKTDTITPSPVRTVAHLFYPEATVPETVSLGYRAMAGIPPDGGTIEAAGNNHVMGGTYQYTVTWTALRSFDGNPLNEVEETRTATFVHGFTLNDQVTAQTFWNSIRNFGVSPILLVVSGYDYDSEDVEYLCHRLSASKELITDRSAAEAACAADINYYIVPGVITTRYWYRLKPETTITLVYESYDRNAQVDDEAEPEEVAFEFEWTVNALEIDAKPESTATMTLEPEGFRVTLGTQTYVKNAQDQMIALGNWDVTQAGGGVVSGTFAGGTVTLTQWPAGVSPTVTLDQRLVSTKKTLAAQAIFSTVAAPVVPASFSFGCKDGNGLNIVGVSDADGGIHQDNAGGPVIGSIDVFTGTVKLHLPWANAAYFDLSTLTYQCVTYEELPLDEAIIGIDATRLPSDGRVPIYRPGGLVLIHHTATLPFEALSPTQVIDCERERLYRVAITDANRKPLTDEQFTVDRLLGTITLAADLDLTDYTAPYTVAHTVADLRMITNTSISGRLGLNAPLMHDFPASDSYVSSVLFAGTLQAQYSHLFMQGAWNEVWQDSRIGAAPLAQYDDISYPIEVTNAGAYTDRILIRFTNATEFQCFGERLGHLGSGNTSTLFEPRRSAGDVYPLFRLHYQGWGAGTATGNCLRFNLIGAAFPFNLIRAIQPSSPTDEQDGVELLLLGNIDAV
jgi:hypothetical protein